MTPIQIAHVRALTADAIAFAVDFAGLAYNEDGRTLDAVEAALGWVGATGALDDLRYARRQRDLATRERPED